MVLSEHGTVISILREVFEKAPFNVWMSSFIVLNSVLNLIVDSMKFSLLSMPGFNVAKLNFSESVIFDVVDVSSDYFERQPR